MPSLNIHTALQTSSLASVDSSLLQISSLSKTLLSSAIDRGCASVLKTFAGSCDNQLSVVVRDICAIVFSIIIIFIIFFDNCSLVDMVFQDVVYARRVYFLVFL